MKTSIILTISCLVFLFSCKSSKSVQVSDSDGDGLTDKIDNCINEFGPAENNGCPWALTAEDIDILEKGMALIEFESGKDQLRNSSFTALEMIAGVMKNNDNLKFEIGNYTDSAGSEKSNLRLTIKRAEAIKDFLVSKGVSSKMITTVGYGESNPLADNSTPEGRNKNRRTVIKVID